MQTIQELAHAVKSSAAKQLQNFPPLEQETRSRVNTACAAFHLTRKPQTLLIWACKGGPIQPIRINKRLAWSVSDIKCLLSGGAE
jgi:hypothetical protein